MSRPSDEDIERRSSHWLHQALADDRDLAPPLAGRVDADVCIVGGGYMGLWTAIRLKDARPPVQVIGDARAPRSYDNAIHEAAYLARQL